MGEFGLCFHPEHEVALTLHESLTTMDERELAFLRVPDKGDAYFCFHPEHDADLSLHESLTAIDARELDRCR